MVNEKFSVNGRNGATFVARIEEAAAELRVLDIADWRHFHDSFCVVANEANGNSVDTTYQNVNVKVTIW